LWPGSEREPIWSFSQKETAAPEGAAVRLRQPAVRSLLDRNPDGMFAAILQGRDQQPGAGTGVQVQIRAGRHHELAQKMPLKIQRAELFSLRSLSLTSN